ncbi:MAG TPA: hypothetical protein VH724_13180 [Candidatus Angelobacter sp.]|jgi:drug/metabolite transporter (DMT)-like permease|nr:hypothetical protein [Candidatus Angelobacter sp.]
MKWLLRFYPAQWRNRYGTEFASVLAEQPASMGLFFDVLGGAIDAHLHPQIQRSTNRQMGPKQIEGEDTMTMQMLQRCATGGPKLSAGDRKAASVLMIGGALVIALAYVVLSKFYHKSPAVEALGYSSFPVLALIYEQAAYLRRRSVVTQVVVVVAGFAGMYLFMLACCVIASKL